MRGRMGSSRLAGSAHHTGCYSVLALLTLSIHTMYHNSRISKWTDNLFFFRRFFFLLRTRDGLAVAMEHPST